ncbi:unnamed protein product, partial [marine sediment metagenome]
DANKAGLGIDLALETGAISERYDGSTGSFVYWVSDRVCAP